MANVGMSLLGLQELDKAMDAAEGRYDKATVIAASKGAAIVQKAAKANIKPTGDVHKDPRLSNLRAHIKRRLWKKSVGFAGVLIGPLFPGMTAQQRSYYGSWLEEGHRKAAPRKRLFKLSAGDLKRAGRRWKNAYGEGVIGQRDAAREALTEEMGTSRVAPHPYLRPALDNNKARAEAEMAKVFRDATDGKITESDLLATAEELIFGE
jgi:HK97 gp10 family phage protein